MTPAVTSLDLKKIAYRLHRYHHSPLSDSYGKEAAESLGLDPDRVFKTLVTQLNGESRRLGVAIVPVSRTLDLKCFAQLIDAKTAAMAELENAQKATGYKVGGISPFGQKRMLRTVVDQSVAEFETIFVSAGKRGLELEVSPADLIRLTGATVGQIVK